MLLKDNGQPVHPYCIRSGKFFPVRSNQKYNDYLKEVADLCGIKIPLLLWFIECLDHALDASSEILSGILKKATFWQAHQQTELNDRQRKMIGTLLDETLVGKLNNSK